MLLDLDVEAFQTDWTATCTKSHQKCQLFFDGASSSKCCFAPSILSVSQTTNHHTLASEPSQTARHCNGFQALAEISAQG